MLLNNRKFNQNYTAYNGYIVEINKTFSDLKKNLIINDNNQHLSDINKRK